MDTLHHIIPKSRGDKFNVHEKLNHLKIRDNTHKHLHDLFQNKTPKEQFRFLFDINETVLSRDCKRKLYEVLTMTDKEFYEESLIKTIKVGF